MTTVSITSLNDNFIVGSASSGHDFVQNMYGMYIRFEQNISTEDSNLLISNTAYESMYKPLIATSLGHKPDGDTVIAEGIIEGQDSGAIATNQLLKITRDYKDVLVSLWKNWEPDSSWEEFRDGPLGFELITSYEEDAAQFTYDLTLSFEELVKSPHRALTAVVNHLLPRQDNSELDSFGSALKEINFDVIDTVVDESQVRSLREGTSLGLLESVGLYKQFLSADQIAEVEEFISSL